MIGQSDADRGPNKPLGGPRAERFRGPVAAILNICYRRFECFESASEWGSVPWNGTHNDLRISSEYNWQSFATLVVGSLSPKHTEA